jgi:hypothetical protein
VHDQFFRILTFTVDRERKKFALLSIRKEIAPINQPDDELCLVGLTDRTLRLSRQCGAKALTKWKQFNGGNNDCDGELVSFGN